MRVPRTLLLPVCLALTALAYYLILFTTWATPYHGGGYRGVVMTQAVAALAIFACLEVLRTERITAIRAVAGALAFPLVLVILLTLWYGLRRHVGA